MYSVLEIVNMFWVGKLGKEAIAGIVLSANFTWVLSNIMVLVSAGVFAMVAHHIGSGNKQQANFIASQGVLAALALGFTCSIITIVYAEPLLGFYNADPNVSRAAIKYFRIIMAGFPLGFIMIVVGQAISASGNTRISMFIGVVTLITNIVLDPFLIFGWLFFPQLGLRGAAIATLIARFVGMLLGFYFLVSNKTHINIFTTRSNFIPDTKMIWQFLKIGIPAFIGDLTRPLTSILLFKIVAVFGTAAIAAFGVGFRALGIGFIFVGGIWTATSVLVGQFLGKGNPEKSQEVTKKALILALSIQLILTTAFLLMAEWIIMIFNTDPEVIRHGANYIRWISLGQIVSVFGGIYGAAFRGAGDTKPPMYNAIFVNWFIKIPLAVALSIPIVIIEPTKAILRYIESIGLISTSFILLDSITKSLIPLGLNGVWAAITASMIVEGIIMSLWFYKGNWKNKVNIVKQGTC